MGLPVRDPELTFAALLTIAWPPRLLAAPRTLSSRPVIASSTPAIELKEFGIEFFDVDDPQQGIVHVVAPDSA